MKTRLWSTMLVLALPIISVAADGETALIEAVKAGDAAQIQTLISGGGKLEIEAAEADGSRALHWAAQRGNVEIADILIAAGANVSAATRYNMTPLDLACASGNADLVKHLLDAGADPNSYSRGGQTPLMTSARQGNVGTIRTLLAAGAQVDATEPYRMQTALMWAAGEGNTGAVELLIEFGAQVNSVSRGGFTPLLFAVRNAHKETAELLLNHGADVDDMAVDGTRALNVAVVNAYYELAAMLLEHGADPNLSDPRGSALHTIAWIRKPGTNGAAGVGNEPSGPPTPTGNMTGLELARLLLEHGADPNVRVSWSERRFSKAEGTARNPPDIILGRHLLTYSGATAFYVAAKNGDVEMMRVLAEGGADATIPNRFGVTPLMVAAGLDYWEGETPGPFAGVPEAERLEAVKLAVALGNDVNTTADFGDFPMEGTPEYTLLYYPLNMDELLELGMGDPRWDRSTALHGSVLSNQPSITQYLIDAGAKVDAKTELGWTPLMMARGVFLANAKKEFPEAAGILEAAMERQGLALE